MRTGQNILTMPQCPCKSCVTLTFVHTMVKIQTDTRAFFSADIPRKDMWLSSPLMCLYQLCFLCTSCLGLSYRVSVCENACSPNYVKGLNPRCWNSVQWFKMCVFLCVFRTHRKAFTALFLVSNRENWSWKLLFNIKELRVHWPSPLSPRFFNTSSALSLKHDTHFFCRSCSPSSLSILPALPLVLLAAGGDSCL